MANGKRKTNEVKQEVAPKQSFSIAAASEDMADKGFEQMGANDLALPFLKVLGQLSPQVTQGDPAFIADARPGMIFNSVTQDLFDGQRGIEIVPCYYKLEYLEWPDRQEGANAPVNTYPADSDILSQTKRDEQNLDRLPNGNYIQETASHFVLRVEDGQPQETALMSMKATQRKKSKMWNSMMRSVKEKRSDGKGFYTPAMFTQRYLLNTVLEKNAKGTWYGWKISHVGPVQNQMTLDAAMGFYDSCMKGNVNVKYENESSTAKPVTEPTQNASRANQTF
jgi:hypothetical protein|tara:strand:- start:3580 stop:4419 length:840 start_codon:yes stop_codon:yes gene_type:complete